MAVEVKQLALGLVKYDQITAAGTPAPNEIYKTPTGKAAIIKSMVFVNNSAATGRFVYVYFLPSGASQTVFGNYIQIGHYNGFAPDTGGESRYAILDTITLAAGDRIFATSGTVSGDSDKIDFVISGFERDA